MTNTGIVRWHTMVSLDGYVAGPDDEMSWAIDAELGSGDTIDEIVNATGALLVGRRTQDVEDRDEPGFYGGAFSGPFFVLRHDPPDDPPVVKGVTGTFLDTDIVEAVAIARRAAGGRDVGILGGTVARQCLQSGLLDEIVVHIAPLLLGAGVRLFEHDGADPVALEPISVTPDGQTTALRFRVPRGLTP